jgi:hypothetical protein
LKFEAGNTARNTALCALQIVVEAMHKHKHQQDSLVQVQGAKAPEHLIEGLKKLFFSIFCERIFSNHDL